MYDIDAGRSHALRLDSPRTPSVDEEIAAIEKQMEALSLRHCELMEAKRVAFAQAQPIPATPTTLTMSTDFWECRHHVMAGTTAKVARASGHIDLVTAAAAGEIEDLAAGLRRERN